MVCSYCGTEIRLDSITPKGPTSGPIYENRTRGSWGVVIFIGALVIGGLIIGVLALGEKDKEKTPVPSAVLPLELPVQGPNNTVTMAPFVLNIPGSDGPHYIKTKISLTLSDKRAKDLMNSRNDLVKDAVQMIIQELTFEQAQIPQEQEKLKIKIDNGVEMIIGTGTVTNVEFVWFTLQ